MGISGFAGNSEANLTERYDANEVKTIQNRALCKYLQPLLLDLNTISNSLAINALYGYIFS